MKLERQISDGGRERMWLNGKMIFDGYHTDGERAAMAALIKALDIKVSTRVSGAFMRSGAKQTE